MWEVTCFAETGTPAALLAGLPLFAASQTEPLPEEEEVALPEMTVGEHVLQDYATIRMSPKAQPVGLVLERFAKLDYIAAERLPSMRSGRRVAVAVLCWYGSGRAAPKGIVFATLEDETGVINSSSGLMESELPIGARRPPRETYKSGSTPPTWI